MAITAPPAETVLKQSLEKGHAPVARLSGRELSRDASGFLRPFWLKVYSGGNSFTALK
jgi:hypothetical protein